MNGLKREMKYV